jgi:hypothetical protein
VAPHDPTAGGPAATPADAPASDDAAAPPGRDPAGPPQPDAAAPPRAADDAAVSLPRVHGTTRCGGLLFLIALTDHEALADALPDRTLRWAAHRLGLILSGAAADDPACLAFAGLGPQDEPPNGVPDPAEQALLDRAAAEVTQRLRALLDPEEREDPAELLDRCIARPAEIVAEPGWIESCMAPDTVSVELRRVGLDLDPGWVPWLGVVVRFVYA